MEPISISALQHYIYCPRQCALIHLEQVWTENLHTQQGRREHERVDEEKSVLKDGIRTERALPVWSEKLELTGKCDVVEFHPDGSIYPIEYKHGPRKAGLHDDVQLCAQALCLEEMLNCSIEKGAIYHIKSKRRREVKLNSKLRGIVQSTLKEVKAMLAQQQTPEAIYGKHCKKCSLKDRCMPEFAPKLNKEAYSSLFEPLS